MGRKSAEASRTGRLALVAVALFVVSALFVFTPASPSGASAGTRYLDPIFAGALDPTIESTYDPSQVLNQHQTLSVSGLGGTYTLSVAGQTTAPIAPTASATEVQAALQGLTAVNLDGVPGADLTVTGGPGNFNGGNLYHVTFTDTPSSGGYPRITGNAAGLTTVPFLGVQALAECDRCLDVYQPTEATAPPTGRPVVLIVHGGAFVGGTKDSLSGDVNGAHVTAWAKQLAALGYVTVPINYTLTDPNLLSLSQCDWNAGAGNAGACPPAWYAAVAKVQYDTQAAVRWLRRSAQPAASGGSDNPYRIDPTKIMVVGESAGAFGGLNVNYKPDDPGVVGVTGESSAINAVVSLAGMMIDSDQRPGASPALLLTFTNDPLGEFLGLDMYDMSRRVVARANAAGNLAELSGYCRRMDLAGDGVLHAVHLVATDQPEFADQVSRATHFFYDHVTGPTPTASPAPAVWSGGPRTVPFTPRPGQQLYGHHTPVTGDFDGDGRSDVVWYGAGSECDTVWYGLADHTFFDPKETFGSAFSPQIDLDGAYTASVGDFDGDGRMDIAWYDPNTGVAKLWYGNADRSFTKIDAGTFPAGLKIATGDFDHDGRGDLVLYSSIYQGAIVTFGSSTRGVFNGGTIFGGMAAGLTPVVGDFDHDQRADIYWQGPTGSQIWYGLANALNASFNQVALAPSPSASIPLVGDVDGDGFGDLFWYQPGKAVLWYGGAAQAGFVASKSWMTTGESTVTGGDFDGDGRFDILWHKSTSGSNVVWYGTSSRVWGFLSTTAGASGVGVIAAAGAFDGALSATGKAQSSVLWFAP